MTAKDITAKDVLSGAYEHNGGIPRLAKPEAKRIEKAHGQLKDFEDEKRNVYQKHMDIASEKFEQARQVRAGLNSVMELRNKLVHDKVQELKTRNDMATTKTLDSLKTYSRTFDDGLVGRRERWKGELKASRESIERRVSAAEADFAGLDQSIKDEHEQCKEATQAGIGPIWDMINEHSRALEKTIAERKASDKEFCDFVAEHFERLRAMLTFESKTAQEECNETMELAKKRYADLNVRQSKQDDDVRKKLAELRKLSEVEKADAANSNQWLTYEMMQFMAHFETNVEEASSKQAASKQYLQTLKSTLDFKG